MSMSKKKYGESDPKKKTRSSTSNLWSTFSLTLNDLARTVEGLEGCDIKRYDLNQV